MIHVGFIQDIQMEYRMWIFMSYAWINFFRQNLMRHSFPKEKKKNVVNTKIKCKKYVNLTENNKHATLRHKGILLKCMQMVVVCVPVCWRTRWWPTYLHHLLVIFMCITIVMIQMKGTRKLYAVCYITTSSAFNMRQSEGGVEHFKLDIELRNKKQVEKHFWDVPFCCHTN